MLAPSADLVLQVAGVVALLFCNSLRFRMNLEEFEETTSVSTHGSMPSLVAPENAKLACLKAFNALLVCR